MRVGNGLAGSFADIDTNVVTIRHDAHLDLPPDKRNESPNGDLLLPGEGKEISFVPPRDNQAVSATQRKSIGKRSGMFVHSHEVSTSEPVTEDTIQFASPRYPRPRRRQDKVRFWHQSTCSHLRIPIASSERATECGQSSLSVLAGSAD